MRDLFHLAIGSFCDLLGDELRRDDGDQVFSRILPNEMGANFCGNFILEVPSGSGIVFSKRFISDFRFRLVEIYHDIVKEHIPLQDYWSRHLRN